MKRWFVLACTALLGVAAIVISERQKVDVSASPAAILYLVADTEHELTRMPVKFARMSEEEEIRIGNQLATKYASERRQTVDPGPDVTVNHYLTEVGLRLAANAHRKLPYKFHYVQNMNQINAFALPGGHVYITEGLLSVMDSEDELAAVLGHEIEHIDHYHCAERAQTEEALRKVPLGMIIAIPVAVFQAGYSKDQELEADREGTRLAVEAGYSPEGAIRMFEKFERLYKEYQAKPKTPDQEAAQVAEQTIEGYFRTHPLTSERIAQIQKLISTEGWPTHPERDLGVAYVFLSAQAGTAYLNHHYGEAEQLANRSLQLNVDDQPGILRILARAQFAQAKFAEAAASWRKFFDMSARDGGLKNSHEINLYAEALAAADRHSAAAEFRGWAESVSGITSREVEVDEAGLELLAGDAEPANKLEVLLKRGEQLFGPESLAQLGWWHYWNGDYPKALELLSESLQERPGDLEMEERLAWVQVEARRYNDALQTLGYRNDRAAAPFRDLAMVAAVAYWRAHAYDEALRRYRSGVAWHPEWENSKWVAALYSPTVAQSVQEMRAESEHRKR